MTAADRELVAAIRAELAAIDPARACDRRAELAALTLGGAGGSPGRTRRDPLVARLVVRLGRGPDASAGGPIDGAAVPGLPDHCRSAWLRGLFLAHGSLSLAAGRTHLEFAVSPTDASTLAATLAALGLPGSWRVRRGRGVVTWKSAESVTLFLRRIGAGAALLELEARSVARTLRGELNRVLNAESANLRRSVSAAGRQLAAIEILDGDGRLARQPYVVRSVAAGRRETPEATLTELAERLELHRSAVQRALDRLERLALEDVGS